MDGETRVGMVSGAVVEGWVEEVLAGYRGFLRLERGVGEVTVAGYEPDARLFVCHCAGPEGLGLEGLTAADVSGFLARECGVRRVAAARRLVTVARSVLRYLHVAGVIGAPLDWAVPAVAPVRGRSLPRGVSPETVAALLDSCDRRRVVGRRDYAIVLLLVRLGLRAGEVAGLGFDDLDWRAGEVLVHGKGGRRDRLPLPVDVGEALADYLRHRPGSEHRAVFLQMIRSGPPITRHTVSGLVREASARAGVGRVAPHQLRHTAASGMLGAGASLAEIAQVMRHSQQRTTEVYARVDRAALRTVALAWPEVMA
jgi:site-specific recombinase XerD